MKFLHLPKCETTEIFGDLVLFRQYIFLGMLLLLSVRNKTGKAIARLQVVPLISRSLNVRRA